MLVTYHNNLIIITYHHSSPPLPDVLLHYPDVLNVTKSHVT